MYNFHWPCMALVSWHCYTGTTGKGFHDTVTLAKLEKSFMTWCYTGKTGKGFMTLLHWQNWKRISWHYYTGKTEKRFYDTVSAALANLEKVFMTLLHWQNWKRVLWHCYTGKTGKCWQSKLKRGSFYRQQRILRLYMWILPPWLVKVVLPTARH